MGIEIGIACVAWVYEKGATLDGVHRAARDPWLRASQSRQKSIPIPIAIAIWMKRSPNHRLVATGNPCHSRNDVLRKGSPLREGGGTISEGGAVARRNGWTRAEALSGQDRWVAARRLIGTPEL